MQKLCLVCNLSYQHAKNLGAFLFHKKKEIVEIKIPDIQHPVKIRLFSSDVYILAQIFISGSQYNTDLRVRPQFIIDAGAHIGLASLWFTNQFPEAEIIAIEPQESNFRMLEENVRLYPNIKVINAALWSHNTSLKIQKPKFGHGNAAFTVEESDNSHPVQSITIDDIFNKFRKNNIDILKLDIEGAEREIFQRQSDWLNRVKVLIIELHDFLKKGCKSSFYRAIQNHDFEEIEKGENVILFNRKLI